jgi:hypothetical protein
VGEVYKVTARSLLLFDLEASGTPPNAGTDGK